MRTLVRFIVHHMVYVCGATNFYRLYVIGTSFFLCFCFYLIFICMEGIDFVNLRFSKNLKCFWSRGQIKTRVVTFRNVCYAIASASFNYFFSYFVSQLNSFISYAICSKESLMLCGKIQ